MKRHGLALQNAAIYLIIIVTFFGNALFFISLNTDTLHNTIETETTLAASLLSIDIEDRSSAEELMAGHYFSHEQLLFSLANPGDNSDAWIVSSDGTIYSENGAAAKGNLFENTGLIDPSVLEEAQQDASSLRWIGRHSSILLQQQCCVVRPLFDGELFLVIVNHCASVQAMQRRQFTLLMLIDIILVFVTIVLIDNIIAKYRKRLIRMSTTDELTGLSNRKSFTAEFAEYMERERPSPFSLFLLDIDFFKQINDNNGHAAGDHVLQVLSEQIQSMVRTQKGFAGRWGGDEFIGILPLPGEKAHGELQALCRTIAALRLEDGLRFSISVGVTGDNGETVLSRLSEKADLALYHSKENGRNSATLYSPTMDGATALKSEKASSQGAYDGLGAESSLGEPIKEAEPVHTAAALAKDFRSRFKLYLKEKLLKSTIFGVRWMAPFVAGGGILIAFAFLFDAASVDLSTLSVSARANFGSLTPLAATFKTIGGITFNFMLPVFAGFMAYGIAGEHAFLAGFVGGYMTIDSNSGFAGAMIAGFCAGVIANEIQQFTRHLPKFLQRAAPIIIYPVFNLLLMQGISWLIILPISNALGTLFTSMLETTVARSHPVAGALSAMMMATDMGGIINKVAYNYGVGHITLGQPDMMASIMLGGMVPPIGIFLSMLLFRKKYTESEWERGYGTLFMGLSFITEGALPYVFTDILRVIPSCMVGSAVGGILSVLFGCELPAPHGGIFVFPVMEHPIRFALALFIGSLVTAVILGLWKKEKQPAAAPDTL